MIVAGPVGREHGAAPLTGPPARGPVCDRSCAILIVDLFRLVISDACHALIVILDTIRTYSCNDSLEGTVASAATSSGSETAGMRARRPSPTDSNGTDCLRSSDVHGPRAACADAVAGAQGCPRDDPRRIALVACRALPRAGVHPPGASTSTPLAAVAEHPARRASLRTWRRTRSRAPSPSGRRRRRSSGGRFTPTYAAEIEAMYRHTPQAARVAWRTSAASIL